MKTYSFVIYLRTVYQHRQRIKTSCIKWSLLWVYSSGIPQCPPSASVSLCKTMSVLRRKTLVRLCCVPTCFSLSRMWGVTIKPVVLPVQIMIHTCICVFFYTFCIMQFILTFFECHSGIPWQRFFSYSSMNTFDLHVKRPIFLQK